MAHYEGIGSGALIKTTFRFIQGTRLKTNMQMPAMPEVAGFGVTGMTLGMG